MRFAAHLHNRKLGTPMSTANPDEGSSLVNFSKWAKLSAIPLFLDENLCNLMASNRLLPSFDGILAGIWGNLPDVGKIPLVCSGKILVPAHIGKLTLITSVLYVSRRKRVPFCRFWGDNFKGKSFPQNGSLGGLIYAKKSKLGG